MKGKRGKNLEGEDSERKVKQTDWSGSASQKEKQKALDLRHQRGIVKAIPVELLTTAITERLVFALQIAMTAGTNRKGRVGMVEGNVLSVVRDLPGKTVGEFFIGGRETQQFIWRSVECSAELFQSIDGRGGFAAGDGAEIPGTEMAEFRGSFIGKITAVADAENGGGKFLGEHGEPSPSV